MRQPVIVAIAPGVHRDIPLQCRVQGGEAAAYSADDVLSAAVWQAGIETAPVATATAAWYTDRSPVTGVDRQRGYDVGEVTGTLTSQLSFGLQPTTRYFLHVSRTLAADTTQTERIATVELNILRLSGY